MPNNGNALSALREKMMKNMERERQAVEQMTQEQFNALSKSLLTSSKDALSTTERGIQDELLLLESHILTRCRQARWSVKVNLCLAVLVLIVGVVMTCVGVTAYYKYTIESLQAEAETLTVTIGNLENQARLLMQKTWGVELYEGEQGRFIVLPKGVTTETWTLGKKEALLLKSLGE